MMIDDQKLNHVKRICHAVKNGNNKTAYHIYKKHNLKMLDVLYYHSWYDLGLQSAVDIVRALESEAEND